MPPRGDALPWQGRRGARPRGTGYPMLYVFGSVCQITQGREAKVSAGNRRADVDIRKIAVPGCRVVPAASTRD